MVLENFISLFDWLTDLQTRCAAQKVCYVLLNVTGSRLMLLFFLIADSYKYTWISNKVYKDLSAALLPSVSVSNPGYSGLSHGEYTGILVSDSVNQDLQATLYISVSVSNPGYSGLSPKVYTGISVGDKVYKDPSATLYPKVSVCNLGYSSLSPGLECRSATKYNKVCELHCTQV